MMGGNPSVIYLAPECCYDKGSHEGRCWCEDNVWPCADCPDPRKARATQYKIANASASADKPSSAVNDDANKDA